MRAVAARLPCTARRLGRRMLGAGYTGPREAGYDEAEMSKLRALEVLF